MSSEIIWLYATPLLLKNQFLYRFSLIYLEECMNTSESMNEVLIVISMWSAVRSDHILIVTGVAGVWHHVTICHEHDWSHRRHCVMCRNWLSCYCNITEHLLLYGVTHKSWLNVCWMCIVCIHPKEIQYRNWTISERGIG